MAKKPIPTPEELRQLLEYDPGTGKLFWKPRTPDMMAPSKMSRDVTCRRWNTRFAGTEAFTAQDAYGYRIGNIKRTCLKAHRVVFAMTYGAWPESDVDHINRDRSDNRIQNLREASRSENLSNTSMKAGASGYFGVRAIAKKWEARLSVDGATISAGLFDTPEIAAREYDNLAREHRGEFARQNFPSQSGQLPAGLDRPACRT